MPGGNTPKQSDEIVYIGGATVRKIRSEDWEKAGVKDQGEVVWSKRLNRNRVKVSDLNKEAVELLLADREFVVAAEGEKAELPVERRNPDNAGLPAPNGE